MRRAYHFLEQEDGGHASLCPPYGITMNKSEFLAAVLKNPVNERILQLLFELALPDAWLVSGCLVQTVWNVRTGRAVGYGISDYDIVYFDPDRHCERSEAIHLSACGAMDCFVASLLAMASYRTTPDMKPALRRGGLMSFFRKQCASLPA